MSTVSNRILGDAFLADFEGIMNSHNSKVYGKDKKPVRDCSCQTRKDRQAEILRAFKDLHQLGYRLKSPHGFKDKHLVALAKYWESRKFSSRTLNTRFSMMNVFCSWIGKANMPRHPTEYFSSPEVLKRSNASTVNKAWGANGVDVLEVLAEARLIDERFGLYLSFQHFFGLRVKESIEMRPLRSIPAKGSGSDLLVSDGTKGGLARNVPIWTKEQRDVLDWAIALKGRSARLRWPNLTWEQAQTKFYHLMAKLGATKAGLGVTAHGLRHGYAQYGYHYTSGYSTPIEVLEGASRGARAKCASGSVHTQPQPNSYSVIARPIVCEPLVFNIRDQIDPDSHRQAAAFVSRILGHIRPDVFGMYGGTWGHSLRVNKITSSTDKDDF